MSQTLQIVDGEFGMPPAPAESAAFHQVIIDRLMDKARAAGWAGAQFLTYWREDGKVAISIAAGAGWPGLEDLRADMARIRIRPEPKDFDVQDDGQRRMFG